ncbi:hypothetical protein HKBW3S09_01422, partial [Candidatus Hakubella thermalkaliphila]
MLRNQRVSKTGLRSDILSLILVITVSFSLLQVSGCSIYNRFFSGPEPEDTVIVFFENLKNRNYAEAYELLEKSDRQRHSLDQFRKEMGTVLQIQSIQVLSSQISGQVAEVTINLTTIY